LKPEKRFETLLSRSDMAAMSDPLSAQCEIKSAALTNFTLPRASPMYMAISDMLTRLVIISNLSPFSRRSAKLFDRY